ncbi:hypothetical protein WJX81_007562 [Elliptochloris bilobata]|uniref:phosphoglycerate mutase (2,3-diphosphoglycerate-independent) n=1 Tax=Elliptochloris bilobata TaxID=381761 RepID=A0AAW1R2J7_9CHLO
MTAPAPDDKWKLKPHPSIPKPDKPLLVVVLDGWGEGTHNDDFNAIHKADTPCMDSLKEGAPQRWRLLKAHGTAVGLPTDDDMGNSEVGHNALGAGQVVDQGARLCDKALESHRLWDLDGWKYLAPAAQAGTLHLIGLLSDGGVHSRYDQLLLLLTGAAERGAERLRVHCLTDGRDVEDGTSVQYMQRLQKDLATLREAAGVDAAIASGGGRMRVTMDRYESDWKIVERGWDAHVLGEAPSRFTDPVEAVEKLREPKALGGKPASDQWLEPFVIVGKDDKPVGPIEDGDAVVIFNFRADRVLELSRAFEYEKFDKFERKRHPKVRFAGLMQYDGEEKLPKHFLVPPPDIERTTGEYLARGCCVPTYACSESQKIGHVSFFWNGNRGQPFNSLETWHEVPSDKNIPFNEKPEMKSREIADLGKEALRSGKFDGGQVRLNFPNPDMVGHTGDLEATIVACTAVDKCVKELLDEVEAVGGRWLVTADHGNAEDMVQRDKKTGTPLREADGRPRPLTAHTLNPVPVVIGGPGLPDSVRFREDLPNAGLANVGPTILNLLGYEAPPHMVPTLLA